MRAFILRYAKYVAYPVFYVFALVVCFYITFPWDSLKEKIVAEFAKSQASKGDKAWRLEIGEISGYWFTGVELENVKIVMPASDDDAAGASSRKAWNPSGVNVKFHDDDDDASDAPANDKDKDKPTESVVAIPHAHARVELLPLLIGRVRVDFQADAFGGNVHGTIPSGGGTLDVELENVDLGQVAPLRDLVSLPMKGIANGKIELTSEGKWSKSNGSLDLKVANVVLGDGKAKLMGKATLPPAQLGDFEVAGKFTDGVLKLEKFGASGKDVEVIGAGTLRVRDPWDASALDLYLRFSFNDAYKVKDDKTLALFGDPNDPTSLPAMDLIPKLKQAKRPDGFWGFRGHGALKRLRWDPTKEDGPTKTTPASAGQTNDDDDSDLAPPPTPNPMRHGPKPRRSNPADGEARPPTPRFKTTPSPPRAAEPDQVGGGPGPDQAAPQPDDVTPPASPDRLPAAPTPAPPDSPPGADQPSSPGNPQEESPAPPQ
jgi:type II secretion system protein N